MRRDITARERAAAAGATSPLLPPAGGSATSPPNRRCHAGHRNDKNGRQTARPGIAPGIGRRWILGLTTTAGSVMVPSATAASAAYRARLNRRSTSRWTFPRNGLNGAAALRLEIANLGT
jgi:hypothetical protein